MKSVVLVLEENRALRHRRKQLEADIVTRWQDQRDFVRLQTVPGIGPILALIILAEARDVRPFSLRPPISEILWIGPLHRESGQSRGTTHLSKPGNARPARRSGWRARSRSACDRIVFAGSSRPYMRPDPANPTGDPKRIRLWPPRWLASDTRSSRPAPIIAASPKRRDQAGGSLRPEPLRRMRPRR
jgi:hypothetical protein